MFCEPRCGRHSGGAGVLSFRFVQQRPNPVVNLRINDFVADECRDVSIAAMSWYSMWR
jgi:hypothetical protein